MSSRTTRSSRSRRSNIDSALAKFDQFQAIKTNSSKKADFVRQQFDLDEDVAPLEEEDEYIPPEEYTMKKAIKRASRKTTPTKRKSRSYSRRPKLKFVREERRSASEDSDDDGWVVEDDEVEMMSEAEDNGGGEDEDGEGDENDGGEGDDDEGEGEEEEYNGKDEASGEDEEEEAAVEEEEEEEEEESPKKKKKKEKKKRRKRNPPPLTGPALYAAVDQKLDQEEAALLLDEHFQPKNKRQAFRRWFEFLVYTVADPKFEQVLENPSYDHFEGKLETIKEIWVTIRSYFHLARKNIEDELNLKGERWLSSSRWMLDLKRDVYARPQINVREIIDEGIKANLEIRCDVCNRRTKQVTHIIALYGPPYRIDSVKYPIPDYSDPEVRKELTNPPSDDEGEKKDDEEEKEKKKKEKKPKKKTKKKKTKAKATKGRRRKAVIDDSSEEEEDEEEEEEVEDSDGAPKGKSLDDSDIDDEEKERLAKQKEELRRNPPVEEYYAGSSCAERVQLFHAILHFKLHVMCTITAFWNRWWVKAKKRLAKEKLPKIVREFLRQGVVRGFRENCESQFSTLAGMTTQFLKGGQYFSKTKKFQDVGFSFYFGSDDGFSFNSKKDKSPNLLELLFGKKGKERDTLSPFDPKCFADIHKFAPVDLGMDSASEHEDPVIEMDDDFDSEQEAKYIKFIEDTKFGPRDYDSDEEERKGIDVGSKSHVLSEDEDSDRATSFAEKRRIRRMRAARLANLKNDKELIHKKNKKRNKKKAEKDILDSSSEDEEYDDEQEKKKRKKEKKKKKDKKRKKKKKEKEEEEEEDDFDIDFDELEAEIEEALEESATSEKDSQKKIEESSESTKTEPKGKEEQEAPVNNEGQGDGEDADGDDDEEEYVASPKKRSKRKKVVVDSDSEAELPPLEKPTQASMEIEKADEGKAESDKEDEGITITPRKKKRVKQIMDSDDSE